MVAITTPPQLVGRMVKNLTVPGEVGVVAISRQGRAILPISGTEFQEGDILHLVVLVAAMERVKAMLGLEDGGY